MTACEWGEYIQGERIKRGWTQRETARLFGVSRRTYQKWEQEGVPDCVVQFITGMELLGHAIVRSGSKAQHLALMEWIPDK